MGREGELCAPHKALSMAKQSPSNEDQIPIINEMQLCFTSCQRPSRLARERASKGFAPARPHSEERLPAGPSSGMTHISRVQISRELPSICFTSRRAGALCLSLAPRMGQQWKLPNLTDRMQLVKSNLLRPTNLQTEHPPNVCN